MLFNMNLIFESYNENYKTIKSVHDDPQKKHDWITDNDHINNYYILSEKNIHLAGFS